MRSVAHRLMQHPQNADVIAFHPANAACHPTIRRRIPGKVRVFAALAWVVREQAQGTVKIIKIAVGLRVTPSSLRRNPDVGEVFLGRLGKTNFNLQAERGLRCGPLLYPAARRPAWHCPLSAPRASGRARLPAPPAAADLRASVRWPSRSALPSAWF